MKREQTPKCLVCGQPDGSCIRCRADEWGASQNIFQVPKASLLIVAIGAIIALTLFV